MRKVCVSTPFPLGWRLPQKHSGLGVSLSACVLRALWPWGCSRERHASPTTSPSNNTYSCRLGSATILSPYAARRLALVLGWEMVDRTVLRCSYHAPWRKRVPTAISWRDRMESRSVGRVLRALTSLLIWVAFLDFRRLWFRVLAFLCICLSEAPCLEHWC